MATDLMNRGESVLLFIYSYYGCNGPPGASVPQTSIVRHRDGEAVLGRQTARPPHPVPPRRLHGYGQRRRRRRYPRNGRRRTWERMPRPVEVHRRPSRRPEGRSAAAPTRPASPPTAAPDAQGVGPWLGADGRRRGGDAVAAAAVMGVERPW